MGREVRRVPPTWKHPEDENGNYVPTYEYLTYEPEEIAEGLRDGWLTDDPPHYGCSVMPDWPDEERTHYQMYENTTEGTPISPVMASPEELAQWLVDNEASAFANLTTNYESWLRVCQGGYAPSAVSDGSGRLVSGVEALTEDT